jgi:hypothetical protein
VAATPVLAALPEPAAPTTSHFQPRPASVRTHSKVSVRPEQPEATPAGQLADTLKQCRALGYHAAQCLKRGCTTTRYGLACKG